MGSRRAGGNSHHRGTGKDGDRQIDFVSHRSNSSYYLRVLVRMRIED
jgi:hypothetical protein